MSRYNPTQRPAMFAPGHNHPYTSQPHQPSHARSNHSRFGGSEFEDIELGLSRPARVVVRHEGDGPSDGYPAASENASEPWLRPDPSRLHWVRKHPYKCIFGVLFFIAFWVGVHFAIRA